MLWEKVFSFLLIPQKHHSADLDICRVLGERDGLFSLAQTYLTPETLHSVSISPQTEAVETGAEALPRTCHVASAKP